MFCARCGTENTPENKFCKRCGAATDTAGAAQSVAASPAWPAAQAVPQAPPPYGQAPPQGPPPGMVAMLYRRTLAVRNRCITFPRREERTHMRV